MDAATIIQTLSILAAGAGAAKYVESSINKLSERMDKRLDGFDGRLDNIHKDFVGQKEYDRDMNVIEKRLDHTEQKLGEISQKAQIIVARHELNHAILSDS